MNLSDGSCCLLTGDDWASFMQANIAGVQRTLLMSYYMVSPHWPRRNLYSLDLVQSLCDFSDGTRQGYIMLDEPDMKRTRIPFNVDAAQELKKAGWRVRLMRGKATLHEKVAVFDSTTILLGSHNISLASASSNIDFSIAIKHEGLAKAVERHFWFNWRIASEFKE